MLHPRLENIGDAGVPWLEFHYAEKASLLKELGIGWFRASGSNCPQMNDRSMNDSSNEQETSKETYGHQHHKETRRQSGNGHRRFTQHRRGHRSTTRR